MKLLGVLVVTTLLLGLSVLAGSAGFMNAEAQIVWDIRLPRGLGAWCAGALLGLAGALAQGVFRNPLADPFLLGSASGAATAVALLYAVLASTTLALSWLVPLGLHFVAFLGAVSAVLLTLLLARDAASPARLLLAGIVVGMMLSAVSALVSVFAPTILLSMQAFMLGTTGMVGWTGVTVMAMVLVLCSIAAVALARVLDALSLGEDTALSLGLKLVRLRLLLVIIMALATGTAVANTGLIAFVGLVAPHTARALFREAMHARLLWTSALLGGALLLAADIMARVVIAPAEIPVGILTALLGGAYLLHLMYKQGT